MFRTTHPTVQARNPQARLDVVRIRRGEGLELLQRGCVRTGVGEPFRFRPLIWHLRSRLQEDAQNSGCNEGHELGLYLYWSPGPSARPG